ncbi:MAG: phosphodiester glycosidase family protein [Pseudomonadota bacterium]|nr:phosphodiester glycosidase family protein [Pseudomonadota bacterium]
MRAFLGLIASIAFWPIAAHAVDCASETFDEGLYTVCRVDNQAADIRLFLRDDNGQILGGFGAVRNSLEPDESLAFAMNGGMYHPDRRPVGYYVEEGKQVQRLFPNAGPGNFGLVPNGVYCIRDDRADVVESKKFEARPLDCTFATQSGPMLVINGALHPRFLENSSSRFVRNGVGTSADGSQSFFVKSESAVNFHTFARFFKDHLRMPQALFLDGKVSRIYAPQIGRSDAGFPLGPIIGVVE